MCLLGWEGATGEQRACRAGSAYHCLLQCVWWGGCHLACRPPGPRPLGLPRPAPCSLLGAGVDFGEQTDWGRWDPGLALDAADVRPWLFVAQQKRLSLREMGIYEVGWLQSMSVPLHGLGGEVFMVVVLMVVGR